MIEAVLLEQLPEALDAKTVAAGQAISSQLSTSEWLGPLAPIALSPFFGLATLSGIATYGPDWLQQKSALFQTGGPLNNPWLFWTMATLAVLTSLPRLTKVSKPISLAAEKLEAYSAIIILISVRMLGGTEVSPHGASDQAAGEMMLSAGFGSISLNLMMSIFAAINVFVVNLIKLFFEFVVWLVPVPTIDAMLEVANKSLCAALMSLYCYSPWLATIVNLSLLAVCLIVFNWVYRRVRCYKELIAGPVFAKLLPAWFAQQGSTFTAFIESSGRRLPKYQPVKVTSKAGGEFEIVGRRGFQTFSFTLPQSKESDPTRSGWISQRLTLDDPGKEVCVLCFRKWVQQDALYQSEAQTRLATN